MFTEQQIWAWSTQPYVSGDAQIDNKAASILHVVAMDQIRKAVQLDGEKY